MEFFLRLKKADNEHGQALIIVMLILVIIAVIATGVASRTLSDVRRTGRERASLDAFAYAESALQDISGEMGACLTTGNQAEDCIQLLCGSRDNCVIECKKGSDCELLDGFDTSNCSELSLQIQASREVNNRKILKDEAIEFYVANQAASGRGLSLTWSGENLMVTKISRSQTTGYFVSETSGKRYLTNPDTVNMSAAEFSGVEILRIRAIGGEASVSLDGFADPAQIVYSANGFCGDVSKTEIMIEPVVESMDGIFDHVLYSNVIEKDLPGF